MILTSRLVCFSLSLLLLLKPVYAASIDKIKVDKQDNQVSLTFDVKGQYSAKGFVLKSPNRAVIDFYQTRLKTALPSVNTNSVFKHVRKGNPNPRTLRMVFDLKEPVNIVTKKTKKGLIVQLNVLSNSSQISVVEKKQPFKKSPYMISRSPSKSLRDVVVIIDPGHGGKDPGAIGPSKHREKAVVLAIAKKLKQIIDEQPGMKAVLTRNGDYYIGLRQRLDIARDNDGDLFISIHADAFKNRQSNGASVFALSQTGATSEAARWLAEKENYSELGGVDLSELDDQNGVIRSVLIDLSQTATIGASLRVGEQVLHAIDDITRLHHRDVEQARFVVLKSPDIPSILVETGFISNPREEKNLTSPWYQKKLAESIFRGVKQYFFEYPPHGTLVESMSTTNRHFVKKGETLGGIAAKYHTSIQKIKLANKLSTSRLLAGQSLVIPSSKT